MGRVALSERGSTRGRPRSGASALRRRAALPHHRADLIVGLGPRLEPGDEVLDLACGDGGLGELLLERGLRYRGVDSTPEMAAEAQRAFAIAHPWTSAT